MARILVVDDDDVTRGIVAEFLSDQGHECTLAKSVAQACVHLRRQRFDLTISDFNMPSRNGLELLRQIVRKWPANSFILISGQTSSRLRRKALALGAVACVAKPFKLQDLLDCVEGALQARYPLRSGQRAIILRRPEDTRNAVAPAFS